MQERINFGDRPKVHIKREKKTRERKTEERENSDVGGNSAQFVLLVGVRRPLGDALLWRKLALQCLQEIYCGQAHFHAGFIIHHVETGIRKYESKKERETSEKKDEENAQSERDKNRQIERDR